MASKSEKICNSTDKAKILTLSANALVSRTICGAMASDPANVCDPVQYPEEGVLGDQVHGRSTVKHERKGGD